MKMTSGSGSGSYIYTITTADLQLEQQAFEPGEGVSVFCHNFKMDMYTVNQEIFVWKFFVGSIFVWSSFHRIEHTYMFL